MAYGTTGTFSATDQSDTVTMRSGGFIAMDFAGTATVAVQIQMPGGSWMTVETATADYYKVWYRAGATVRLNCTAHTNNVEYAVG